MLCEYQQLLEILEMLNLQLTSNWLW